MKTLKHTVRLTIIGLVCIFTMQSYVFAADDELVPVNIYNFVRAETAVNFDRNLTLVGGEINKLHSFRKPVSLDEQYVIRVNRDTLYTGIIVDISKGAVFTLPDAGGRYMTAMVINEDHHINKVYSKAGTYKLTMKEFDTPYVMLVIRILVDASDPEDIKKVNALQDLITVKAVSAKPYTHPNYDPVSYKKTLDTILELGRGVSDYEGAFGAKEDVGELRHLIGTAMGWGGLPDKEAFYLNVEPNLPVGAYQLTVKDVPVDAFWSISIYDEAGAFQKNKYNIYTMNNITGTPNKDCSFTVHFGGDPKSVNYLPIMEGWNYSVRLYKPRKEILERTWVFPSVNPVK